VANTGLEQETGQVIGHLFEQHPDLVRHRLAEVIEQQTATLPDEQMSHPSAAVSEVDTGHEYA
jgi:hypothetical protein